jgi:alkylation response protein AidB-like acyl-CoA dehydrogenase
MDFDDTPAEAAFRAEARSWLEAQAEYRVAGDVIHEATAESADDEAIALAQAWQQKKADASWACIGWPKEYGGRGATPIEIVIWEQEESKFRTPPNVFADGHGTCGPTIMTHGTPEQKAMWLPRLLSGQEIWCQLFSEPSAGSDLAGLRLTAVQDDRDWILNGQKIWTSHAHYSSWGVLVARHDPTLPKHAGLTYFVVDMHSPGIEVRPITQITGARGFSEVFFTDARVPDRYRLGEVGDGWRVAMTSLMNERAASLGSGGVEEVRELIRFAEALEIDGAPAIADRAVTERLASFYTRAKGVELTGRRALTALSHGHTPGPETSLMKLVTARLLQEAALHAMELLGTAGATMDEGVAPGAREWQERYLGAPGNRIAGGTDEVLRNIIAERVLGLPPEARVDKGVAFKDVPTGPPTR